MFNCPALKLLSITAILLFASCATTPKTDITDVHIDPQYKGGAFKKLLIIGVSHDRASRVLFEDDFVWKLQERGIEAFVSYRDLDYDSMRDSDAKETIVALTQELGVDAVIATKLLGTGSAEKYQRVYFGFVELYEDMIYYFQINDQRKSPSKHLGTKAVYSKVATNLFEVSTGKLIFSAASMTITQERGYSQIETHIEAIVKKLSDEGLIK